MVPKVPGVAAGARVQGAVLGGKVVTGARTASGAAVGKVPASLRQEEGERQGGGASKSVSCRTSERTDRETTKTR